MTFGLRKEITGEGPPAQTEGEPLSTDTEKRPHELLDKIRRHRNVIAGSGLAALALTIAVSVPGKKHSPYGNTATTTAASSPKPGGTTPAAPVSTGNTSANSITKIDPSTELCGTITMPGIEGATCTPTVRTTDTDPTYQTVWSLEDGSEAAQVRVIQTNGNTDLLDQGTSERYSVVGSHIGEVDIYNEKTDTSTAVGVWGPGLSPDQIHALAFEAVAAATEKP